MLQPTIRTKRLILRPFTIDDAAAVQSLAGNFNIAKTTLNIPHPYEDGMAEKWIASLQPLWESRTGVVYAIALAQTNAMIGAVDLHNLTESQAELGYWVGEPYWGKGYCTEAAEAMIRFAFTKLSLELIIAVHLETNPASGKVLRNVGMSYVRRKLEKDRFNEYSTLEEYEIRNVQNAPGAHS